MRRAARPAVQDGAYLAALVKGLRGGDSQDRYYYYKCQAEGGEEDWATYVVPALGVRLQVPVFLAPITDETTRAEVTAAGPPAMVLRVGAAVQDGMDDQGRTASPVATLMARARPEVEEHPLCILMRGTSGVSQHQEEVEARPGGTGPVYPPPPLWRETLSREELGGLLT